MNNRQPRHISDLLFDVLGGMADSVPVEAGSKEFHQQEAAKAAYLVRSSYSEPAKKKARNDCMSHLRASLSPTAATVEQNVLTEQFGA